MSTGIGWIRWSVLAGLAAAVLAASAQAQDDEADARWLADVLELNSGATVADIGAGTGALSIDVAPYIGPGGHIYATELGAESVASLAQALNSAGLTAVTVLEGHPDHTNLPPECCDAVFIRFVYHHFANPPAMNASIWQSLKPGGRVAVIDFAPRGREAAQPSGRAEGDQHGVTATTLQAELEQADFTVLSTEQRPDRRVQVVAMKASRQ